MKWRLGGRGVYWIVPAGWARGDVYTAGMVVTAVWALVKYTDEGGLLSAVADNGLYWGPLGSEKVLVCCRPLSCPLAKLASQARFPERWLALAGAITMGLSSEGRVLAGISRFFGGRHSLLRSWFDFMASGNLYHSFWMFLPCRFWLFSSPPWSLFVLLTECALSLTGSERGWGWGREESGVWGDVSCVYGRMDTDFSLKQRKSHLLWESGPCNSWGIISLWERVSRTAGRTWKIKTCIIKVISVMKTALWKKVLYTSKVKG